MVLNFARIEGLTLRINAWSNHVRAPVHIGQEKSRADAGLGVEPGASVSVPASTDLKVKRALHPIFLCPNIDAKCSNQIEPSSIFDDIRFSFSFLADLGLLIPTDSVVRMRKLILAVVVQLYF